MEDYYYRNHNLILSYHSAAHLPAGFSPLASVIVDFISIEATPSVMAIPTFLTLGLSPIFDQFSRSQLPKKIVVLIK
jgi:hypothetical protein